ncbi:hypothetical protein L6164_035235 [Bauhinia variegata]|uniref:Uncharacterized protein n=1 Tax=Bauhinia variegata TaxID=167791 RepID=A0ACB9KXB2_BAUVA|nr:hypothetical protein L6164_035235 [Bauhinia variegata]
MDECKRSGQIQIPPFGNWDYANELPITQYFECARQAGLVRYSSSSGECDPYVGGDRDLYALDFKKPVPVPVSYAVRKTRRNMEKRFPQVKEKENSNTTRKQGNRKVCDVTEPPRKPITTKIKNDTVPRSPPPNRPRMVPKPVDEDLYKIPPELLRTTKRKKLLGFISKCLVPATCVS